MIDLRDIVLYGRLSSFYAQFWLSLLTLVPTYPYRNCPLILSILYSSVRDIEKTPVVGTGNLSETPKGYSEGKCTSELANWD